MSALPQGSQRPYAVRGGQPHAVAPNEILCIVGESGSGKSLTARAVMGLLPQPHVRVSQGAIRLDGEDLSPRSATHGCVTCAAARCR